MFQLLIAFVSRIYAFFQRSMPTNILIRATHTRRGLKWGVPAMLLAIPYLLAASICTALIDGGASRWLYVVALVCIWNALKFIVIGPVSVGLLVQHRRIEHRAERSRRVSSRTQICA